MIKRWQFLLMQFVKVNEYEYTQKEKKKYNI